MGNLFNVTLSLSSFFDGFCIFLEYSTIVTLVIKECICCDSIYSFSFQTKHKTENNHTQTKTHKKQQSDFSGVTVWLRVAESVVSSTMALHTLLCQQTSSAQCVSAQRIENGCDKHEDWARSSFEGFTVFL